MNYHKMFLPFLLVLTGCNSQGYATVGDYTPGPEEIKCPKDYFAYCEGNTPKNLECGCVDRKFQRQILDRLTGGW